MKTHLLQLSDLCQFIFIYSVHWSFDYSHLSTILQAERLEKEKMKQMVLNLNERQEEEEYQGTNSVCGR